MTTRPRYASAQDAARAAAEAAQIIKRNEAQNTEQREVWEHARAEFDRLTSLTRDSAAEFLSDTGSKANIDTVGPAGHCEISFDGLSNAANPYTRSVPAGCPIGPETPAE